METIKNTKYKAEAFVVFPAWETISNHADTQFSCYLFKKWLGENLYLCIEHRPNIHNTDDDVDYDFLEASFCNRAGFAIASETFPFCEDGYHAAIAMVIHWAETFSSIFTDVANKSLMRKKPEQSAVN